MSVAAPKSQAKEPIDLDVLLVCRKRAADGRARCSAEGALRHSVTKAAEKIRRFGRVGRRLSRNDVRVVLLSQILVDLSVGRTADEVATRLDAVLPRTREIVENLWRDQEVRDASGPWRRNPAGAARSARGGYGRKGSLNRPYALTLVDTGPTSRYKPGHEDATARYCERVVG